MKTEQIDHDMLMPSNISGDASNKFLIRDFSVI